MTQKHSPEPWCTDQMSHEEPLMDITIIAANDDRVAKVWIDDAPVEDFNARQRLNARRIVACVNACIGISTEALEKMPNPFGVLLSTESFKDIIAQREDLQAEVDELLDLLQSLENDAAQIPQFMWTKIQHVVKKHTGETK